MQRRGDTCKSIEKNRRSITSGSYNDFHSCFPLTGIRNLRSCLMLSPLIMLISLWLYATWLSFCDFSSSRTSDNIETRRINSLIRIIRNKANDSYKFKKHVDYQDSLLIEIDQPLSNVHEEHHETAEGKLLSRDPKVIITSSVRGNLGPPSVLNQDPPGNDWIKDRWQAASDMGGTAILGTHWIALNFSALFSTHEEAIFVTKVVLDWETAFANDYRIEGRMDSPKNYGEKEDDIWCVLYDSAHDMNSMDNDRVRNNVKTSQYLYPHRIVEEYGQSPGVQEKLPLHVIHSIAMKRDITVEVITSSDNNLTCQFLRYLRIFIRKPARGWGVSLWEVDIYGFKTSL